MRCPFCGSDEIYNFEDDVPDTTDRLLQCDMCGLTGERWMFASIAWQREDEEDE